MVESMKDLERTWNSKFNYPWTFFNDVPFTSEFKRKTSAVTKAKCNYGQWCQAVAVHGLILLQKQYPKSIGRSRHGSTNPSSMSLPKSSRKTTYSTGP